MTTNIVSLSKTSSKTKAPDYPDTKLLKNGNIRVLNTSNNVLALCDYIGFKPAINKMNYSILIDPDINPDIKTVDDLKSILISEASKSDLPKAAIEDHLYTLCTRNTVHPVKDWIERDTWDGVKRVDSVLEAFNFKHKKLSIAVMKHWLVSAIAALVEEIFSTKIIPIIQGEQSWCVFL